LRLWAARGITRENALAVLATGVDSVAVIGDLLPAECNFESMRTRMEQWQNLVK
jgi:thiamine monophosphate synthase